MENNAEKMKKMLMSALDKSLGIQHLQEEVQHKIDLLIDNIDTVGIPFRDAFIHMFKYEHLCRMLGGKASKHDKPGALGRNLSDETYKCCENPVKALLHLNDWTKPNDSDVLACLQICHSVDLFEKLNFFNSAEPSVDVENAKDIIKNWTTKTKP